MASRPLTNNKNHNKSKSNIDEELELDNQENNIKLIKRTLKNNTHLVIEDTRLKSITSWRKSQTKFLQNLIFNFFSFGILHLVSLHYPKLYLKLYCNPWPPKECDFFLIENIYGNFTLCPKIYKKSKKSHNINNIGISKDNSTSSLLGLNYKMEQYISRNLTYSFKYKSVTYEYNEETNDIRPVYLDLSKMTNKAIFNYFSEGLSSENIIKKFEDRYGKNEYYINLRLPYFYFKKIEILYFVFIIALQAVKLVYKDNILFIIFLGTSIVLVIMELILNKIMIHDLYKKEFTLDGESHKIKVKRNHKLINSPDFFYEIQNRDLLPGDIIYLKSNDLVPCDCLILEGECIVNENSLNGSLDILKKKSLEINSEQFNYETSKFNILYHGMKIVKTISKLNNGYISVLCINTGPNTYKANQLSNILYLLERKEEYKSEYNILGGARKSVIYLIVGIILITIIFSFVMSLMIKVKLDGPNQTKYLINSGIRIFIRSCLPVLFLTNSIIYFIGIIHLKNENILCFDKSKLPTPAYINTIFFGKTGILCENKLEINGYHPIYVRSNNIYYRTYRQGHGKEMNSQLLKYYKNYLNKCQNNNLNQDFNPRHGIKIERNQINLNKSNNESNECVTLFLECLLCCNNVEKYNSEIFGNSIETYIFRNMKWDLKSYRFNNNDINNKSKEINYSDDTYLNEINSDNNKYNYDNYLNIIDRNINDIYPNNYFKITESFNRELELQNKPIITRFNSKFYLEQMKKNNNNNTNNSNVSEFSIEQNSNFIKNDISKCHITSYKLRIYKRFIKNGSLNSSAIVYNFITKELRFMTKGIPENILDKCDKSTIPDNFYNTISLFRRKGLIIIVCASKIISLDDYKDSSTLDEYMNNLTFCGFISLKNKLKEEIINSIKDLRQFDCNLIISTGDNVFNCLPIGFDSTIIENKNIFTFDKEDDKKSRLLITKIYSVKKESEDDEDNKTQKSSVDKLSRHTMSSKVLNYSTNKPKDTVSIRGKKEIAKNSDEISIKQGNGENIKINEKKLFSPIRNIRGNINRNLKSSNNLLFYGKNKENEKKNKKSINDYSDLKFSKKENSKNMTPLNLHEKNTQSNTVTNIKSSRNKISNNNEYQGSSTSRKIVNRTESKNRFFSYFEKYYYYPTIFEEMDELTNNSIYCMSGRAFNFLYQNKEKKQCKKILEKMFNNCKIYYNMSSIDKSLLIDFYREHPNCCTCYIGKDTNDYDAIMTSNVGINLNPPHNENTILCHFYSIEQNILSLKKLIREGRAISENVLLLTITCVFYSLILNSYLICYLFFHVDIVKGQINFLEIFFLILSISGFTVQYDETNTSSNKLMQNKKLYFYHYVIQIVGAFIIKLSIIFSLYKFYIKNAQLENTQGNYVFCSYYFVLCVEQLFSIFYVFNYISFYRKHPLNNAFFVIFNLLLIIYFIILISLNSSNFKFDFFSITNFEFNENIIDSYDDNNRLICFWICFTDFGVCFLYTKIIYFIFDTLAKKTKK